MQPNEPDLYGYTDENVDALAAFTAGRAALLDFEYGVEIVRLMMAAYLSAERGRGDRPHRRRRPAPRSSATCRSIQQGRGGEILHIT